MIKETSTKNIFRLAIPATLSYATIVLVGVIDLLFVGRLGTTAIAGVSIGITVCSTLFSFLDGLRTGTSVLVSQYLGAKDHKSISHVLTISIIISIAIGLITLPFIPAFTKFIFNLIGNSEIATFGMQYLQIRLFSITAILLSFSLIGFFRGLHNTSMQLTVSGVICLVNTILDYALIYGKLGAPKMGVEGAAIATLISEIAGATTCVVILFCSKLTKNKIRFAKPPISVYKKHAKIAFESGLYTGFTSLAVTTFAFIFARLGTKAVAINQIGSQIFMISYLPQYGFFVAASVIISKLFGEKNHTQIKPMIFKIITWSLTIVTICSSLILIFARPIVSIFSPNNDEIIQGVLSVIAIICLDQIVSSLNLVLKGSLTGINDTRFIATTTFLSGYVFLIPASYLLGIQLGLGIWGAYLAFLAWSIVDATTFGLRLYYKQKRFKSSDATIYNTPTTIPVEVETSTNINISCKE